MTSIGTEINELLRELESEIATEIDIKNEVCTNMLIERGMSKDQATRVLRKKVADGKLTERWALYNGARVKAYQKVEEK